MSGDRGRGSRNLRRLRRRSSTAVGVVSAVTNADAFFSFAAFAYAVIGTDAFVHIFC
jgi:hypothetical protein